MSDLLAFSALSSLRQPPTLNDFGRDKIRHNAHCLRRNPPEFRVTSGQKPSTKITYIVLQTSVGLF